MMNYLYQGDIPENLNFNESVAIDTEAMGLNNNRDRLCLVQLCTGDSNTHLVQLGGNFGYKAKNLKLLLKNKKVLKIFHYARFDLALIKKYLGILPSNVYCTKIASKLARTYTDKHGLRELCKELLGIEISKQQQSSYWGANTLSKNQIKYAANDVLHLHNIKYELDSILKSEKRYDLFLSILKFLPTRVKLDLSGWESTDIFAHS
ncbi:MAG: ribonuclease D [Rickettsiales bacterium]|nr:ribonuclease D [Rickettsiales bacterium]